MRDAYTWKFIIIGTLIVAGLFLAFVFLYFLMADAGLQGAGAMRWVMP